MPEYLSPGVYVEEIDVGPKPIEGVSTSNLGIVGPTELGPESVQLIGSWLEYARLYGQPTDDSKMGHAVKGFFDNGGKRCFVARVTGDGAHPAVLDVDGILRIRARGPGVTGNNIMVKVTPASLPDPELFKVIVLYYRSMPANFVDPTVAGAQADANFKEPTVIEVFDNVSYAAGAATEVVQSMAGSNLVDVQWVGVERACPQLAVFTNLATGSDGATPLGVADYRGSEITDDSRSGQPAVYSTGLTGLAEVDEVSLLAAPDEHAAGLESLRSEVIQQCSRLRDRFAILSVKQGQRGAADINPDPPTMFAAVYWPWIFTQHPSRAERVLVPPVGHVAGIFARTDVERGVHKAPANATVRGALDLEFAVARTQQDILNPKGVNVIRDFRADGRGIRLWGARTMAADPSWKYVSVRRLFLFLEESIDEGTQWVVFEPNAAPLWDRVRRSIEAFLTTVWRNGALMGTSPEEAFYVKCDRSTMTQDDIDNGRLICYIGVAAVKPAEFVIFRIHQWTLGAETAV